MGLCEKCDDRASGSVDCDLTSERERKTREREKGSERMGEGGVGGYEGGQTRLRDGCRKGGKSDAGKGNEDGVSLRKIVRMNVK